MYSFALAPAVRSCCENQAERVGYFPWVNYKCLACVGDSYIKLGKYLFELTLTKYINSKSLVVNSRQLPCVHESVLYFCLSGTILRFSTYFL